MLQEEKIPDDLWQAAKRVLLDTANEIVGCKESIKRKTWISDGTFSMIKETRKFSKADKPAR